MDFIKDALKSQSEHKPSHTNSEPEKHHDITQTPSETKPHKQPSTSELITSAKVVAEAARAQMGNTKDEVDRAKVAAAASDLLDGVKHYGKLEETSGLGKYVGKAETYLHNYGSSHPSGGSTVAGSAGVGAVAEEKKKEEGHGHGHGGAGDYLKMAEGLLRK